MDHQHGNFTDRGSGQSTAFSENGTETAECPHAPGCRSYASPTRSEHRFARRIQASHCARSQRLVELRVCFCRPNHFERRMRGWLISTRPCGSILAPATVCVLSRVRPIQPGEIWRRSSIVGTCQPTQSRRPVFVSRAWRRLCISRSPARRHDGHRRHNQLTVQQADFPPQFTPLQTSIFAIAGRSRSPLLCDLAKDCAWRAFPRTCWKVSLRKGTSSPHMKFARSCSATACMGARSTPVKSGRHLLLRRGCGLSLATGYWRPWRRFLVFPSSRTTSYASRSKWQYNCGMVLRNPGGTRARENEFIWRGDTFSQVVE